MGTINYLDTTPLLGVAITTFQSEKVIIGCLNSLLACRSDVEKVVITDNASHDASREVIRQWAEHNNVSYSEAPVGGMRHTTTWLTLLVSPVNGGFAYSTNRSLELLKSDPTIDLFWLLNPDCIATPDAAAHFRNAGRHLNFSLMGGRTLFEEARETVQTDGGRVSRWTGVCQSVNWGKPALRTAMPDGASLDFITGANCVASRRFLDVAGLLEEGYFLYYEEVDWAFRRGNLPLKVVPEAIVHHFGGTSIGSGSVGRRPSPFSNYFNYRNRIRFVRKNFPVALPVAIAFGIAKAAQAAIIGAPDEARAILAGILGLKAPRQVASALTPEARKFAFHTDTI